MLKIISKKSVLLLVLFTLSFFAKAQNENAVLKLDSIMKKFNAVGLSVAVVKNNHLHYAHSFGLKNIESQTLLKDTDIFRIASISKSFSATSVMQLVERGKLSLNDDISTLVGFKIRNPKYPETVITLKMLLSHTSSINDREGYFSLDVINPDRGKNVNKCFNSYEPGKGYQYCNLNFNLTGAIIERASGERFDQYVKKHILDPLNLYGGYCVDSLDKTRFADLYEYDAKQKKFTLSEGAYNPRSEEVKDYVLGYSTPVFSPTGGMKISAADLAKYMSMHMNYGKYNGKRIIAKKSSILMQTKVSDDENYGLALTTKDYLVPGVTLTGHNGVAYGLYSSMFFNPKEKYGFVVITNGCDTSKGDIIKEVVNCLYVAFIN